MRKDIHTIFTHLATHLMSEDHDCDICFLQKIYSDVWESGSLSLSHRKMLNAICCKYELDPTIWAHL